jgi:hypothetical protein
MTGFKFLRRGINQAALNLCIFTIEFGVGLAELLETRRNRKSEA